MDLEWGFSRLPGWWVGAEGYLLACFACLLCLLALPAILATLASWGSSAGMDEAGDGDVGRRGREGVLVPLKTTLEVREEGRESVVRVFVVGVPVGLASRVLR